jgi:predicted outer membrane repeat protein
MFSFLKRSRKSSPAGRKSGTFRPTFDSLEDRLVPSTLWVTSARDNGTAGTLRYEVQQASADAAQGRSDTIVFANSLRGSTIQLTRGALELTRVQGFGVGVIVNGGNAVTISGGFGTRVFEVDRGANLQLENLTVTDGFAYAGGAAFNDGTLGLSNCTLSGNKARYGGAIFNEDAGILNVFDSTFTSNTATQCGGGIDNDGTLVAYNTALIKNTANYGGGLLNAGDLVAANNCYFARNVATFGGGALDNHGQASLGNTWFSWNSGQYGGAIDDYGSLNMGGCTFHYNSASTHGAAIFVGHGHGSSFHQTNDSFAGNTAPDHHDIWYN